MEKYLMAFWEAFSGTMNWVWNSILWKVPWNENYFYGLIIISLAVWVLEILFPWRKDQKVIRKDFWLDGFYMFFNFFIFSIVISGFYKVIGLLFTEVGLTNQSVVIFDLTRLPLWLGLLVFFIVLDFFQWSTHIALHRFPLLWKFHKVHHSVKEMGFAAHLRYHWMENVLYKPLKTFGVMILGGFEPQHAYIVHFMAMAIGHLNHANIKLSYGPLKYVFNNPVMHLWHHSKALPDNRLQGVNFGISLSLWDYLFRTNYIPEDSGTIDLGFEKIEDFPNSFWGQLTYGFKKDKQLNAQ
ncbi:MAG TPA: sterol desaturase family protein [Cyclobacteriaceae bacterium]